MDALPGTDQHTQASASPRRASRRTFLTGVGLAGAAGLAAPLLGSTSARASTDTLIVYGANYDFYTDWTGYISSASDPYTPGPGTRLASPNGANCERIYRDGIVPWDDNGLSPGDPGYVAESGTYTALPVDWSSLSPHTNYAIVSFRINPTYLLESPQRQIPDNGSGHMTLDGQINHFLSTMPAHSVLTNWQEAGQGNTLNFPGYAHDANKISDLHNHMQALFNNSSTQGNYGQIVIDAASTIGPWLGRNLDCYMIDIYDYSTSVNTPCAQDSSKLVGDCGSSATGPFRSGPNNTLDQGLINTKLTNYKNAFANKTNVAPRIHITETNSPCDNHRKDWFLYLTEWMNKNNGYRICSHWKQCGKDSGDWPTDTSLLDYFTHLQYVYGA